MCKNKKNQILFFMSCPFNTCTQQGHVQQSRDPTIITNYHTDVVCNDYFLYAFNMQGKDPSEHAV